MIKGTKICYIYYIKISLNLYAHTMPISRPNLLLNMIMDIKIKDSRYNAMAIITETIHKPIFIPYPNPLQINLPFLTNSPPGHPLPSRKPKLRTKHRNKENPSRVPNTYPVTVKLSKVFEGGC